MTLSPRAPTDRELEDRLLRSALVTTGPIVELLIRNLHADLAVAFAQQGLRAARLLGLYVDDDAR